MDSNPIHHPSPAKNWNAHFLIMFKFWWSAGLVDRLEPHLPPLFNLKMKCSFLNYIQLLMISRVSQWTQISSAIPLQPKKLNTHFWIMFIFWWLGRLVDGLKPHLQPLSNQQNEMLIFGLCSTSVDWSAGLWTQTPSATPLQPKKMKCSFLDYVQILMIGWASQWTWTPSATSLQPKKWNAHFWITFNFWWLAGLVDGLKPHPPSFSSQKNEMLIFWITFNFSWLAGLADGLKPHPPPLSSHKIEMLIFWIMFNFWWLAGLVNGLEPHMPTLSSQNNEMLIFQLCSTSDDWLGWSIDLNPICHPLQSKNEMLIFGLHTTSDDQPG